MTEDGTLIDRGGTAVLVLERRYPHPPELVWRAVTEPAELAHWFPAEVELRLEPGAPITFRMADEDDATTGEVLEVDPPLRFAFRWDTDVLRIDLAADGTGTRLTFTHELGGGAIARLGAARNAAGWDACLAALEARLDGREPPAETSPLPRMEQYLSRFGLDRGEVEETADGYRVRFVRDLVWRPADTVWQLLTGGAPAEVGGPAPLPATHGYVEAGPIIRSEPPHRLGYSWLHRGEPAGTIELSIVADPAAGTRIELVQTLPHRLAELRASVLAAWHTQLELFYAALLGDVRCPWPADRTEALTRDYAADLA